jgi:hypothetical protein
MTIAGTPWGRITRPRCSAGEPYDVWETGAAEGAVNGGTVLTSTLLRYPLLLWFTGYDWYAPVTKEEEAQLLFYLNHGGRLLLSGQDFIREEERPLGSRMGVARWEYDRGAADAFGVTEHPAGGTWGRPAGIPF